MFLLISAQDPAVSGNFCIVSPLKRLKVAFRTTEPILNLGRSLFFFKLYLHLMKEHYWQMLKKYIFPWKIGFGA